MSNLFWPAPPAYPATPASGSTADEKLDWFQQTQTLVQKYTAEIGAFEAARRLEARAEASLVNSAAERECFLRCAVISLMNAGKTGPSVLVEANAQLAALLAQLKKPAPIPAPT